MILVSKLSLFSSLEWLAQVHMMTHNSYSRVPTCLKLKWPLTNSTKLGESFMKVTILYHKTTVQQYTCYYTEPWEPDRHHLAGQLHGEIQWLCNCQTKELLKFVGFLKSATDYRYFFNSICCLIEKLTNLIFYKKFWRLCCFVEILTNLGSCLVWMVTMPLCWTVELTQHHNHNEGPSDGGQRWAWVATESHRWEQWAVCVRSVCYHCHHDCDWSALARRGLWTHRGMCQHWRAWPTLYCVTRRRFLCHSETLSLVNTYT